jgi:hypothetical protein
LNLALKEKRNNIQNSRGDGEELYGYKKIFFFFLVQSCVNQEFHAT